MPKTKLKSKTTSNRPAQRRLRVKRVVRGSETPRTDSMCEAIRAMGEVARARNLAYLCRLLERELIEVGNALNEQNERWGLYGNESQAALRAFKKANPSNGGAKASGA